MPTLATLTEDELRSLLSKGNYNKALGYLSQIRNPKRKGETLWAQIQGSRLYDVEVDVMGGSILGTCTCSYSWGGFCKHIAALLLYWTRSRSRFEEITESTSDLLPPPPSETPKFRPSWVALSPEEEESERRKILNRYLGNQTMQDLRGMAQQRGWSVRGTRKDDVVDQLVEKIVDRAEAAKGIYSLDSEHRAVLLALALMGELADNNISLVGQIARLQTPLSRHAKVETYTRHLWEQGLAIPAAQSYRYPQIDFIPWVLARAFPPVLETVIPSSLAPEGDQPASELSFASPETSLRTVIQALLLFEQRMPALRPQQPPHRLEKFFGARLTGWPILTTELDALLSHKDLTQYNTTLMLTVPPPDSALPDDVIRSLAAIIGDAEQLRFIYALLVNSGLLLPGSPVTPWAEMKSDFLARSEAEQMAILAKSYFAMQDWNEFWMVLRQQPRLQMKRPWQMVYQFNQLTATILNRRKLVLNVLSMLPDNRWIKMTDLYRWLRALWPNMVTTRSVYGPASQDGWFLTWDGKQLSASEEDWMHGHGAFIRAMLTGPLHWLGVVDLSRRDGEVIALRLHGLADLFWDRTSALISSAPKPQAIKEAAAPVAVPKRERAQERRVPIVDIDEEGRLLVDARATRAQAHGLLDQIAKMESAQPDRFVYRLDAESTHLAFESGVSLDELKRSWSEMFTASMPAPIESQLTAWWKHYGRNRIYHNVHLIEFGDDYALTEMKSVTSLNTVMIAELSPRLVIIPKDAIPKLVSELEAAGYTPKQVL
ncbi:MAG: helicase-associated domain-containing protein [Caldilineaceae bacterium]|nr:helicase-associated domain-containing protein [Caldilineaceae bacterium]